MLKILPDPPGIFAPEVVCPDEAALPDVLPQPGRIGLIEERRPDFRHHHERALEQVRIGRRDDDVVGTAALVLADGRFGELAQTKREVQIGLRVVDRPAAAVAIERLAEGQPAEYELPVVDPRPADLRQAPLTPLAAPLNVGAARREHERGHHRHTHGDSGSSRQTV
jgi:hypothetical protein